MRSFIASILVILSAHTVSAAITGTVTDTSGDPIPRALVMFTSEPDSSHVVMAVTDSLGHYEIGDLPTGIAEEEPTPFALGQNYPNPFNPATTIPFTLDATGHVNLTVYNIMGQRIRTLVDDNLSSGSHSVVWDARDDSGVKVGSGVYLYVVRYKGFTEAKKMLLLDSGGMPGAGVVQHTVRPVAKVAEVDESLYTVTVGRFLYENYTQEYVDILTTTTFDATLYDAGLMVEIPGGTFQMGDVEDVGYSDEKPVHTVTVSTFEMSAYEITNAQYAQYLNTAFTSGKIEVEIEVTSGYVYGKTGSWSGQMYLDLYECWITYCNGVFTVTSGYENWPVVGVTWYGAKAFTERYDIDLPREAEWEYACRWGNHQYLYGTVDGTINSSNANYNGNIGNPVAVGSYPANPFGLHDMSGNVYELCADWYGVYQSGNLIDPTGEQSGTYRIIRGGSWDLNFHVCRSARRYGISPRGRGFDIGFRVVRRPAQQ